MGLRLDSLPDASQILSIMKRFECFCRMSSHITPDHVAEEVSLGRSPEAHLEAIREYMTLVSTT